MVRLKNRYILSEIVFSGVAKPVLKNYDVYSEIKKSVVELHGDFGEAILKSSLNVKYLNPHTHIVLVRAKRGYHQLALQALTFIQRIGQHDLLFKTLHVAGTIRSCQKFLLKYHKQKMAVLMKQCKTKAEEEAIQKSLLNTIITPKEDSFYDPVKEASYLDF